jgi:hypothetical protein
MRGLILPSEPDSIGWHHAAKHISSESNSHEFLEALLMGRDRKVYAHLIVPTCFSIMMDDKRHATMDALIQNMSAFELCVLMRQEDVMTSCAACMEPIAVLDQAVYRRYQLAIRIIGAVATAGEDADAVAWTYDVALGILCRSCQTSVWRNLLLVSESDYASIAQAIRDFAFTESINIDQFMDAEMYGPDQHTITSMGLLDSYIMRLERLNLRHHEAFLQAVQCDADDAMICAHCARAHHVHVIPCRKCKATWFCNRISPDTRLGYGMTCVALAKVYHGPACREIRKRKIFHLHQAWYVDRRDYATVSCFEPQKT